MFFSARKGTKNSKLINSKTKVILYLCSNLLNKEAKIWNKTFCFVYAEWWQLPFLPIDAPLIFFISSVAVLDPVPMLIWGVLVALGGFVLYKAARFLLR